MAINTTTPIKSVKYNGVAIPLNSSGGTNTSDATLVNASDLTKGVTAYGKNGKITGSLKEVNYIGNLNPVTDEIISSDIMMDEDVHENPHHDRIAFVAPATILTSLDFASTDAATNQPVKIDLSNPENMISIGMERADLANQIGLTADKLVTGASVLGINGTASSGGTNTSDATLIDTSHLYDGDVAYGKNGKVTGTLKKATWLGNELLDHSGYTNPVIQETDKEYSDAISFTAQGLHASHKDTGCLADGAPVFYDTSESTSHIQIYAKKSKVAQAIGLTSDKIVSGNTILGVTGTASSGTSTSDATLTNASNLLKGQTAYGPNGKVTGTLVKANQITNEKADHSDIESTLITEYEDEGGYIEIQTKGSHASNDEGCLAGQPVYFDPTDSNNSKVRVYVNRPVIASAIGLTADKIVSGNTILGVQGTATAGGSSKNVQGYHGYATVTTTSYTATAVKLTVAKTGTYKISWMGYRNTNSGTSGSQLYINGTAYGSANTSFVNTYAQSVTLNNVSLTAGQEIVVRARARSTSYVMGVGQLIIEEI